MGDPASAILGLNFLPKALWSSLRRSLRGCACRRRAQAMRRVSTQEPAPVPRKVTARSPRVSMVRTRSPAPGRSPGSRTNGWGVECCGDEGEGQVVNHDAAQVGLCSHWYAAGARLPDLGGSLVCRQSSIAIVAGVLVVTITFSPARR